MNEEKRKKTFDRISRRWRERVDEVKEYEIFEEPEDITAEFMPMIPFGVDFREYQEAEKLKQRLLKKYEDNVLEDVIVGDELATKKGMCYHVTTQDMINLKTINPNRARRRILSDFKLIYGIGEVTERLLKEQEGYKTIEDLIEHPRFGFEAAKFLEIMDICDTCQIIDWIWHWFPKSHPLVFYASGLHQKEDFVIFDIETMGLFTRPIILIGVAQVIDDNIVINQYFLRDISEEPAALTGFLSHVSKNSVFVTFNGRTFDVPYIQERLVYYRIDENLEKPHFDMLHFSRRAWRERVPNCRLITLEQYLFDTKRVDDVPSALVPEFYQTYMNTKNIGPLVPIIEHNQQDLITLANIFSKLHEEWR